MSLSKRQEAAGLDQGSLSRIENSEINRPAFQSILATAAVLDIPHDDIENSTSTLEFLESPNEDCLDAVEKLYRTADTVNNPFTQFSLYNPIIDYSLYLPNPSITISFMSDQAIYETLLAKHSF